MSEKSETISEEKKIKLENLLKEYKEKLKIINEQEEGRTPEFNGFDEKLNRPYQELNKWLNKRKREILEEK